MPPVMFSVHTLYFAFEVLWGGHSVHLPVGTSKISLDDVQPLLRRYYADPPRSKTNIIPLD